MSKNKLFRETDTIVAQATPAGRGGIAILRVSGPLVSDIIRQLLDRELIPRMATYLPFHDIDDKVIDEGVAIFFPEPHSFTGEDVLELHGHGGPMVVDILLQRITTLGARLARAGEFSERAFLNDKMDLTQAEAIADLIDAASTQAARLAIRSLQGEFSKAIQLINEKVIALRMYVEASIDFSEEEIPFLSDHYIKNHFENVLNDLTILQQQAAQGSLLREGMTMVIAGQPNVGKSSLLNALSGRETAIVTPIPGTTRDVLREMILIDGLPLHIIDTAGLRDSEDVIEQEGVRRARNEIKEADIILHVSDATKTLFGQVDTFSLMTDRPTIFIRNKIDLVWNEAPSIYTYHGKTTISLSAKSGIGIDILKQHIKLHLGFENKEEGLFLARRRHLDALARAKDHITQGFKQLAACSFAELVAEDLRFAQLALNEITGEWTADDLLGRIFSNFCIGK